MRRRIVALLVGLAAAGTSLAAAPTAVAAATESGTATATAGSATSGPPTLQSALNANMPSATACYEELRKRVPGAAGKLEIEITINPDGSVSQPTAVSGSFKDDRFLRCLTAAIGKWKLPAQHPTEPETLTLPFEFTPP